MQELITVKESTTKQKILNIANTLRNNKNIRQCTGCLYDKPTDSMCAMGLLGFRAGVPKEDLFQYGGMGYRIWELYGIDYVSETTGFMGEFKSKTRPDEMLKTYLYSIFNLNDNGYSFDEIADIVENYANSLEEE